MVYKIGELNFERLTAGRQAGGNAYPRFCALPEGRASAFLSFHYPPATAGGTDVQRNPPATAGGTDTPHLFIPSLLDLFLE
jgi:hypothetical protein